jgi:preprotein translocase subunit SecA
MAVNSVYETIQAIRHDVLMALIDVYIPPQSLDELWNIPELEVAIEQSFGLRLPIAKWLEEDDTLHEEPLRQKIEETIVAAYTEKENHVGPEVMRHFEKAVMLQVVDGHWKEHLAAMDYLRQGIHLRSYAHQNPKHEYKREAFEMFSQLLERIKHEVVSIVSKVQIRAQADVDAVEEQRRQSIRMQFRHARVDGLTNEVADAKEKNAPKRPFVRKERKIGRNEPCPCGSGKKYKQCHGKIT